MMEMATLDGGGGQYTASLYHPRILIHASKMRGGLEAGRDFTADPAPAALQHLSFCRIALILRLRILELYWSLRWHAEILASMILQVTGDIHA